MNTKHKTAGFIPLAGFVMLLAGCGRGADTGDATLASTADTNAAPAAGTTVWEAMTQVLVPQSNLAWELAGNLLNDDGNIDPALLSAEQWSQLQEAAQAMADSATGLAQAQKPVVAPPGVKILNEGTAGALGAAEVQAAVDANPQAFQKDAQDLVALSNELVAAAAARDGVKTDELSNRLTEVCGGCHMRFWTPNQ